MDNHMKNFYAQKDADGKLIATVQTKETLDAPWFLITQEYVGGSWVWNESTQEFEEPSPA